MTTLYHCRGCLLGYVCQKHCQMIGYHQKTLRYHQETLMYQLMMGYYYITMVMKRQLLLGHIRTSHIIYHLTCADNDNLIHDFVQ